jgi:glutathione peroxidase
MKKLAIILMGIFISFSAANAQDGKNIYDFKVKDIDGKEVSLSDYEGKVILIVNTASKCGFTPQYEGLQEIYTAHKDKGFVVLGFPCNQFRGQEPGSESDIKNFCTENYGVDFPMFSKIDVNGDNADPLYVYLKEAATGFLGTENIKWNFTKFLINKKGEVIDRYAPVTKPKSIEEDILAELAK